MGFAAWIIDVLEIKHAIISNAKFNSRSRDAVIRVYDKADNVIEMTSTRAILKSGEFLLASRRIFRQKEVSMIPLLSDQVT